MTPEQVKIAFRAMTIAGGDLTVAAKSIGVSKARLAAWVRSSNQLQAALKDGVTPYSEDEAAMRGGDEAVALSHAMLEVGTQIREDFSSIGLSPDLAGQAAMMIHFGQFNFQNMMHMTGAGLAASFLRVGKAAQELYEYISHTDLSAADRSMLTKQLAELVSTQVKMHDSVREDQVARAQIDAAMRDAKPGANKKTPGPAMAPASVNMSVNGSVTVQEAAPRLEG